VAWVWDRFAYVVLTSLAAAPIAAGVAALRARRLGWRRAVAEVTTVAGTLPWLWMVFTPRPWPRQLHLIPFSEVPWYLYALDPFDAFVQIVGNLLVFAAFGAAAPVRWRLRLGSVAALAAAGSAGIETMQYVLDIGRTTATDDVLLNTTGAVLAALATRPWHRVRTERPRTPESPRTGTVGRR
jgi:glycopeptide antibiotics resistance protein